MIAGMIPPFVMESVGGRVRKPQVTARKPLIKRKMIIPRRARVIMSADKLTMPKKTLCLK
jgi:hypothetical protein